MSIDIYLLIVSLGFFGDKFSSWKIRYDSHYIFCIVSSRPPMRRAYRHLRIKIKNFFLVLLGCAVS